MVAFDESIGALLLRYAIWKFIPSRRDNSATSLSEKPFVVEAAS